ncbi:MAG: hypothetical protein JXB25_07340 [Deltaproteobacteria bacterium]|nr:hypothetical protein [Deltaproteobacteria bacterium]
MDYSFITDFLEKFHTQRVVEYLTELNIGGLVQDPLVLAGIAAVAALALYLKWRLVFVSILSATALAWLINFTTQRGTEIETMNNPTLLAFIGIGFGIVGLIIYFIFIRTD